MPGGRFRFSHRLTAEAAHAALLARNRLLLHGAAADALASRHQPGRPGEGELLLELVAQFEAAGRLAEAHARLCLLLTNRADLGKLEDWESLAQRSQALWQAACLADPVLPVQSPDWIWALASRRRLDGENEAALELFGQLLVLAQAEGNQLRAVQAYAGLGAVLQAQGRLDEALAQLQSGLMLARQLPDPDMAGRLLNNLGITLHSLGRNEQALEALAEALEIASAAGNLRRAGMASGNLGVVYAAMGRIGEAQACYRVELDHARLLGDIRGESYALSHIGNQFLAAGEVDKARECFARDLEISRMLADQPHIGFALGTLGTVSLAEQDYTAALDLFRQAADYAQAACDNRFGAQWLLKCCTCERLLRRFAEADTSLDCAMEHASASGDPSLVINTHCERVKLCLAQGLIEPARQALDQAQSLAGAAQGGIDARSAGELEELAEQVAAVAT